MLYAYSIRVHMCMIYVNQLTHISSKRSVVNTNFNATVVMERRLFDKSRDLDRSRELAFSWEQAPSTQVMPSLLEQERRTCLVPTAPHASYESPTRFIRANSPPSHASHESPHACEIQRAKKKREP